MEIYDIMLVGKLTGGGGDAPTGTKNITTNGLHDVAEYASADVNVPNTYTASDEGKVVSNGALVGQTSATKTENGTYDTTLNNEVVVNVPQPSGTVNITQNGTVDVAQYASASVNVPSGGGDDSFQKLVDGSIVTATIPSGVTKIHEYAFYGCASLSSLTIPNSVTTIEQYAFYECTSLPSITIPSEVTSIPSYLFYNCVNLAIVTFPSGLTSINNHAFNGCRSLTSVTIPDNVTSAGSNTFYGCTGLTSIVIPSGVSSLGASFLRNCSSLMSITIKRSTPPSVGSNALNGVPANANIYVPSDAVNDYKAHSSWSSRASYIQAIPE